MTRRTTSSAGTSLALPVFLGLFSVNTVFAQQSPIEEAATKGGIRILTDKPRAFTSPPDLLHLKGSGKIVVEAWSLSIDGDVLRYRVLDRNGRWYKESRSKSEVASISIGRHYEDYKAQEEAKNTPPEPVRVSRAEKKPVKKQEILAGTFRANQGRYTKWTLTFSSEVNKYYDHADGATEYGLFHIYSHHRKPDQKSGYHENKVTAKGQYFLYAPGVVGNDEWVLNLTRATYSENDISPRNTSFSDRLQDEVLIVKFTRDGRTLELDWANQSGWQWASPVQQTYRRVGAPPPAFATAWKDSEKSESEISLLPPNFRRGARVNSSEGLTRAPRLTK